MELKQACDLIPTGPIDDTWTGWTSIVRGGWMGIVELKRGAQGESALAR